MRARYPLQPTHLRLANRVTILRYIRDHGTVTRPQVVQAIGLSRPTVTRLVDGLVAEGLLRDIGLGESTASGGKRPGLVELHADGAMVAAVTIGVEEVEAGIVNLGGQIVERHRIPLNPEAGPDDAVRQVGRLVNELAADFRRRSSRPLLGLGVGTPGVVHAQTGVVVFSPNQPGWRDLPLGVELARITGLQVSVENECRAQTLGEMWFGHGRGIENLIGVETGIGIGGAVVLDGTLYRGPDDSAGEVGHTTVDPHGAQCHCGNLGCWESYASTTAMLGLIRDALWRGEPSGLREQVGPHVEALTLAHVLGAVKAGDTLARRYAVDEMGYRLGVGMANLVNIFNPELVVMFGEITAVGAELLERIRKTVAQRALPQPGSRVRILTSALGDGVGLVGAATLVISRVFAMQSPVTARGS